MFKLIKKILVISISVIIVLVLLAIGAAYLALSRTVSYETPTYGMNVMSAVPSLKEKFDTSNLFNFSNDNTSSEKSLFLTKDELDAMFMLYTGGDMISTFLSGNVEKQYDNMKLNTGCFDNGVFSLYLTKKIPYETPFGSYLNLTIKGYPIIKNNNFTVEICKFKIGSLTIPSFILNIVIDIENSNINSQKEVQNLLYAVKELKTQNDGINIIYSPDKLSDFLNTDDLINSLK